MKKGVKVIIALVAIAALAAGAYFILRKKDNSLAVYNNVYNMSYGVVKENINVINEVNEAVDDMVSIIITHDLAVEDVHKSLTTFQNLKNSYQTISDEILTNGIFVKSNSIVSSYIDKSTSYFKQVKEVYEKGYDYLLNTYFEIVDTEYNIATMQTYIVNFNNIFSEVLEYYNGFYFNCGFAYAYGLDNMMVKNNAYKLKVGYAVTMVNEYFNCQDSNKYEYFTEATLAMARISANTNTKYFENKEIYDMFANNNTACNIAEIGKSVATNTQVAYVESLANQEQRNVANNYIDYVVRG
ncbi:MAG: hypothetical protein E7376_04560 [Clostridiales bacterium]|nr:hypothetical protein [Clostridiales bacterium]